MIAESNLNQEWLDFTTGISVISSKIEEKNEKTVKYKFSNIYISTKTKIAFLNTSIELYKLYWKLRVIDYHKPLVGILKKSIKYNCNTEEETKKLDQILDVINDEKKNALNVAILNKINIQNNKVNKYKDTRKIDVGISLKDILSYKFIKKGAFYNCFAIILRVKYKNTFKEVHIKIFNTGKLEIPGIQHDNLLYIALDDLMVILNDITNRTDITYNKDKIENVLINSNFSCGFFINRSKLYKTLKFKYGLHTLYDPCSYPGIQSKFYYNKNKSIQDGKCCCGPKKCYNIDKKEKRKKICTIVSFMIFRTGSVLIVGHCNEDVLIIIYEFLKYLLKEEFLDISEFNQDNSKKKIIKKNSRKKNIILSI